MNVEEERRVEETSPSDDVAEMDKVMCESDWPDKWSICEKMSIQVRITRRVRTTVPSVKVASVDARKRRRELMSRRGRWVKCIIRREVLSDKVRHWRVAGAREPEVSDRNWRRGCAAGEEVVRAAQARHGGQ